MLLGGLVSDVGGCLSRVVRDGKNTEKDHKEKKDNKEGKEKRETRKTKDQHYNYDKGACGEEVADGAEGDDREGTR